MWPVMVRSKASVFTSIKFVLLSGSNLNDVFYKYTKRIIKAESGENSKNMRIYGNPGADKIVPVPVGVTVYDEFMRKIGG